MRTCSSNVLLFVAMLALHACGDGKSLPCRCGGGCGHNTRCAVPTSMQGAPKTTPPASFDNPVQVAEQDAGND